MPEKEEEERPKVSVVDRRHWAKGKGDGDAEAPSVLPTYIEQLEARARLISKRRLLPGDTPSNGIRF